MVRIPNQTPPSEVSDLDTLRAMALAWAMYRISTPRVFGSFNGKIQDAEYLWGVMSEASRDSWVAVAREVPNTPDGYVTFPREMTDDMAEAIALTASVCGGTAYDVWCALLECAGHAALDTRARIIPYTLEDDATPDPAMAGLVMVAIGQDGSSDHVLDHIPAGAARVIRDTINRVPAPNPPAISQAGWWPTHRHRKGGLYRVIARGEIEADLTPCVIYDDRAGRVWVRPAAEFDDGRFVALRVKAPRDGVR